MDNNGDPVKGFPTIEEVEGADKEQLARWYRFLPSGETVTDRKIMRRIAERFIDLKLGACMTPELNKEDRDVTACLRFRVLHFPLLCYIRARISLQDTSISSSEN